MPDRADNGQMQSFAYVPPSVYIICRRRPLAAMNTGIRLPSQILDDPRRLIHNNCFVALLNLSFQSSRQCRAICYCCDRSPTLYYKDPTLRARFLIADHNQGATGRRLQQLTLNTAPSR
jgi:hypothetical protein